MAWQAQLSSAVTKSLESVAVQVDVVYFDDVNPSVILHQRGFRFEPATVGADMRLAIIAEGQAARAAFLRAQQINNNVATLGTTIAIP